MLDTDPQLHEKATSAIKHSPYFNGGGLRCESDHGRVTLKGVVGSYYHKQMAQEIVRRLDGVREIENQLEVTW